jgi:multiple sugar transport system ATP-binding protein
MVFQESTLYPHRTVKELLLPPAGGNSSDSVTMVTRWFGIDWIKRWSSARREVVGELARSLLDTLGLQPLLNRKPHQLSGGERQRVALGRAIVRNPAAFLFDEPFSSLDVSTRWALRSDLLNIQKKLGSTMLFVTHDQSEAFALADRVGVLVDGALRQVGTPEEVYSQPSHIDVARATGDPPMNVWPATAVPTETGWRVQSSWWNGDLKRAESDQVRATQQTIEVWLGVRPEVLGVEPTTESGGHRQQPVGGNLGVVKESRFLGNRWGIEISPMPDASGSSQKASEPSVLVTRASGVERRRLEPGQLEPGQVVRLNCDTKDMHLFDGESGRRIRKAGRS